jgi:hypothetical protein
MLYLTHTYSWPVSLCLCLYSIFYALSYHTYLYTCILCLNIPYTSMFYLTIHTLTPVILMPLGSYSQNLCFHLYYTYSTNLYLWLLCAHNCTSLYLTHTYFTPVLVCAYNCKIPMLWFHHTYLHLYLCPAYTILYALYHTYSPHLYLMPVPLYLYSMLYLTIHNFYTCTLCSCAYNCVTLYALSYHT